MMVSPQAARMGTVNTTLRKIGCRAYRINGSRNIGILSSLSSTIQQVNGPNTRFGLVGLRNIQYPSRFKSSQSVDVIFDEDAHVVYDVLDDGNSSASRPNLLSSSSTIGLAKSAEIMSTMVHRSIIDEPWRINLGRGNDNLWLMNPREDAEWFTGVSPGSTMCPGKYLRLRAQKFTKRSEIIVLSC